jgi:hypothetical protein
MAAPCKELPLASAHAKVEYTKPHGSHPQRQPRPIACFRLLTGIKCLANGDK